MIYKVIITSTPRGVTNFHNLYLEEYYIKKAEIVREKRRKKLDRIYDK